MRKKSPKSSIIWKLSKEKFQNLIDSSNTYNEILSKLGFSSFSANRTTLNLRIIADNINLDKFNENRTRYMNSVTGSLGSKIEISHGLLFVENCKYGRTTVRKHILRHNLIEYKCKHCSSTDSWNNKPLTLQLEHINGINNDNRLENLCFLCPNCHSQTTTWGFKSRNVHKKLYKCTECLLPMKSYNGICLACRGFSQRKFEVTKEELIKLINENSFVAVGKIFGVTDNTIRKRCKNWALKYLKKLIKIYEEYGLCNKTIACGALESSVSLDIPPILPF